MVANGGSWLRPCDHTRRVGRDRRISALISSGAARRRLSDWQFYFDFYSAKFPPFAQQVPCSSKAKHSFCKPFAFVSDSLGLLRTLLPLRLNLIQSSSAAFLRFFGFAFTWRFFHQQYPCLEIITYIAADSCEAVYLLLSAISKIVFVSPLVATIRADTWSLRVEYVLKVLG